MYKLVIKQFKISKEVSSSHEVWQIVENIKKQNPSLSLSMWDWEGTALFKYSKRLGYVDYHGVVRGRDGEALPDFEQEDSIVAQILKNAPEDTTSEMFAIKFRLCVDNVLTNRHVYGDTLCMDLIQELNLVYMDEKIRRRL